MLHNRLITPPSLHKGDTIALITPATVVKEEFVGGAERYLHLRGYRTVRMPGFTTGGDGSFASSAAVRASDLITAIYNPDIKAIWCGRGGYGSVQIIGKIPLSVIRENPKWLIGFSDISALHALFHRAGVVSLHAPMLRRLNNSLLSSMGNSGATCPPAEFDGALSADYPLDSLFHIMEGGGSLEYDLGRHPLCIDGVACGPLLGGNLAVLSDLSATPFDMLSAAEAKTSQPVIFLEDIAESISRVERRLWRLRLAGVLNNASAILFGRFTAYEPNANSRDMESMISALMQEWNIDVPVAYNCPVGHDDFNLPFPIGAPVTVEITPFSATLTLNLKKD